MGFRHVGWSMIVAGVVCMAFGLVPSNATALIVALFGASLLVMGLVALWLGSMESGGLHSGDRWTRRTH
jgi:uncharacterized membrane protein HdeD (DUF308 family)